MSKPKLISFNICPFVQRSVITLLHKKVDFDIEYIDLGNKPDWFLAISPFGKVPVLKVDDTVLFESAVINEYLEETHGNPMHPTDPLRRAHNRAWIEFGSGLIMDQFMLYNAKSKEQWEERLESMNNKLARVEEQLGDGPFFNGDSLSLVDAAYAPVFMRFALLDEVVSFLEKTPKIAAWSKALLELPEVKNSVVPDFNTLFLAYFGKEELYLASLLK